MKSGKAFELLVRYILINIGFEEVVSDNIYVYGKPTCQKINGLGEAHDADVLLEPPVQTPFFATTRLLIECKDYSKRKNSNKVGLGDIRGALGLRSDINFFETVDFNDLKARQQQNRRGNFCCRRYAYNVAVASTTGFAYQAQSMAATHRIPLIDFSQYHFWRDWEKHLPELEKKEEREACKDVHEFARKVCRGMAVAVTNTGQLLFLNNSSKITLFPSDTYSVSWKEIDKLWTLECGDEKYDFKLQDIPVIGWLKHEANKEAVNESHLQNMSRLVVYYRDENWRPQLKMLSIAQKEIMEVVDKIESTEKVFIRKIDGQNETLYEG